MITSNRTDICGCNFVEGEVILVDKHLDCSSFFIVKRIRAITGAKKVGHAGTLDPKASGLLILCTGKKTKEIYKYQDLIKTYTGTITVGKRTESMDGESAVIEEKSYDHLDAVMILEECQKFVGNIEQIPPMYSALKFKGKSLYKYARKGINIDRNPRNVFIEKFLIKNISLPEIEFELVCSKGTYVRVIADDLGKALGCGAYLSKLRRDRIGNYSVQDALTLKEFEILYSNNISRE